MSARRTRGAPRGAREIGEGVRLVFFDRDLVVVDKPAGLLSARVGSQTGPSVFDTVKAWSRKQTRGREPRAAWVIHRLDREVSGLLVFALSQRAFRELKQQLASRRMLRCYAALVEGELAPGSEAQLRGFIADAGPRRRVRLIDEDEARRLGLSATAAAAPDDGIAARAGADEPRYAVLRWRSLASTASVSLLEVRLSTGRKHQIRAQLAASGHPVIGDRLYGAKPAPRVSLHASDLAFLHPADARPLAWHSPPPRAFLLPFGREQGLFPQPDLTAELLASKSPGRRPADARAQDEQGWSHVAGWYGNLLGERGSDHHQGLVLPGTLRLLDVARGARVLDLACGEGSLARELARIGVQTSGVDAAPELIERAQESAAGLVPCPDFFVGDIRKLESLAPIAGKSFDAAACVLALMNLEPFEPVLAGAARLLAPGGRLVLVLLHPAFRGPGRTAWGWESAGSWLAQPPAQKRDDAPPLRQRGARRKPSQRLALRQFRRIDSYLSASRHSVVMNPGAVAWGAPPIETISWHRPVGAYVRALVSAGFCIDCFEEWSSLRVSAGPAASEEDRSRTEIPMFLALRAIRDGKTR